MSLGQPLTFLTSESLRTGKYFNVQQKLQYIILEKKERETESAAGLESYPLSQ